VTGEEFDELRRSAFAIAYRMLGSVSEAEDVVQEGFLRLHRARDGGERIESLRAYLLTVVSRLSLDHLRSARVRRETYVGEWLPEPLVASANDPARQAEMADSLSLAFLVLLESLSPEQRAAYVLHDVFDEPYDRIAEIVGTSEQNARQLATRARRHVEERRPGSRPHASSGRSARPASSQPPRKAISKGWKNCWPTTWCSAATAAARHPPSNVRSTAAPGWRAR
jgi:RNA polymerase sigma factor (sigma-70 family)